MVKEFTDKEIAILWFGLEGRSTLAFLRRHGVNESKITLLDKKSWEELPEGIKSIIWETYLSDIDNYDLIFKTPWITKYMIEQETNRTDIDRSRFTSQTQYFFDHYRWTVIWVTGTKGKSTTVSLLNEMLLLAGREVALVWNVGQPVLDVIDFASPPAIVIYELSSFMIDALNQFHLDIGVFTSLFATHTKEHGGYEAYIWAKFRLLAHAKHLLIWSQLKEIVSNHPMFVEATVNKPIVWYGKEGTYRFEKGSFYKENLELFGDDGMKLLGVHNRYNACALFGVCDFLGIDYAYVQQALHRFAGLEHRIEFVGNYGDIDRYNDAIATTPQATVAAVETFWSRLWTIFLWWSEGEYEFDELVQLLESTGVENIILFPDTWKRIKNLINPQKHTIYETTSLEEAVAYAFQHTPKWKVALLSCGSPSFSLWSGFKEKWMRFKDAIHTFVA